MKIKEYDLLKVPAFKRSNGAMCIHIIVTDAIPDTAELNSWSLVQGIPCTKNAKFYAGESKTIPVRDILINHGRQW